MFDYELDLLDKLGKEKYFWIKKATGLGITEFFLRYIAWRCLRNDEWKGAKVCIVTGPRLELAITLIDRLKKLFLDLNVYFKTSNTVVILNDCRIEAYPSHHLDTMRGLTNVKFILLDEAAFFSIGQQKEVRDVAERYIAKTDPYIIMVSTPKSPHDIFASIESEENSIYEKLFLSYLVGLNTIYTEEEIAEAKRSPSFEREYNLKYGGMQGNVFTTQEVNTCIELGDSIPKESPNPYAQYLAGVDFGYNVSKTVICVGQWLADKQVLRVVKLIDFGSKPTTPSAVAERIWQLYQEYHTNIHFFVDGSNRGTVNEIKVKFGESTQWDKYYKKEMRKGDRIHPINFGTEHELMLEQMYNLVSEGRLAVPSDYDELITAMRSAQAKEWDLDKEESVNNDYLDACRLMCYIMRKQQRVE